MSKKHDAIIKANKFLFVGDYTDPASIIEYTLKSASKDYYVSTIGAESVFMRSFCWPIELKEKLKIEITKRQVMKKELDDSFKNIYELSNMFEKGI